MDTYKIFTKSVAMELIILGCNFLATEDNLKHKGFQVYIFQDDEKFRNELSSLTKNKIQA